MNWLNSKLQIAYDESYQDATNLQSKLQKHQAFDAEVKANEDRIDRILHDGNQLIASDHFAKQQVKIQLKGKQFGLFVYAFIIFDKFSGLILCIKGDCKSFQNFIVKFTSVKHNFRSFLALFQRFCQLYCVVANLLQYLFIYRTGRRMAGIAARVQRKVVEFT